MSELVVLGADPGSRDTGLVVRQSDRVLAHRVVSRAQDGPVGPYVADVVGVAREMHELAVDAAEGGRVLVGLEELVAPSPQLGRLAKVEPLLVTAKALGALQSVWPDAVVVAQVSQPGVGHGQGPLARFPSVLVGARERSGSGGVLRHARSAWDVSLHAELVSLVGFARLLPCAHRVVSALFGAEPGEPWAVKAPGLPKRDVGELEGLALAVGVVFGAGVGVRVVDGFVTGVGVGGLGLRVAA